MSFAIAAGHSKTAETGARVLRAGGNAVDAAIAAAFTSFVAEPIMAQPFGGGFLAIQPDEGEAKILDFFAHTPKIVPAQEALDRRAVHADFGQTKQIFHIGAGTIAVPGIARGFAEALEQYGTRPMAELASDAIFYAKQGIVLDRVQAEAVQVVAAVLESNGQAKQLYANAQNKLLEEGERWKNPDLGNFLELWALEGERFMTEGEGARSLLEASAQGGALSAQDISDYRSIWRKPLVKHMTTPIGKVRLDINPPPSAGGAIVSLILSLLEKKSDPSDPLNIAEALVKARAARTLIGHDFNPALGSALLAPELIADLRKRPKAWRGTTHISVIDANGMGAALTLTNGAGSGIIAKNTGVHINDMLGEPDLIPESQSAFPENTRLCSMMAPAILHTPNCLFVIGAAGSNRIPSAMAQVLLHLILSQGIDLAEILQTPRMHYEDKLNFEDFFGRDARISLFEQFPDAQGWNERAMFFGGVNLVAHFKSGSLDAAGDPRRNGAAIIA